MRRVKSLVLLLALVSTLTVGTGMAMSGSTAVTRTIEAVFSGISVEINEEIVDSQVAGSEEVEPFIYNGRVYIAADVIGAMPGCEVVWDEKASTLKIETPSAISKAPPFSLDELTALGEVIPLGDCARFAVSGKVNASWLGTITYADADTGAFAALAHRQTYLGAGAVMTDAVITGALRCKTLKAVRTLNHRFSGSVTRVGIEGAFGAFDKSPEFTAEAVGFAWPEIGTAEILVETGAGGAKAYTVKITDVAANAVAKGNDDFAECDVVFEITDKALLELTGGSVAGMSGSPILQNGKLVAALTGRSSGNIAVCYGISAADMRARQLADGLED